MSYRTWKRKIQRRRSSARIAAWQGMRDAFSWAAFKEWETHYWATYKKENKNGN